jgi:predicted oxidoreductase (fatty acid repression mutant protein)
MKDLLSLSGEPCAALLERLESESSFVDLLSKRRSIRKLTDGPFSPGARGRLVEAVRLTPAAYNLPPWHAVFIHDRREVFWATIESAFRAGLLGDHLQRFLTRLDGYRSGLGAVHFYEDLSVHAKLKEAWSLSDTQTSAFIQQSLGMAQLSLWLALTHEGLSTSLQHCDWLVERQVGEFLGVSPEEHHLAVVMPFGYPAEDPRETEQIELERVVSQDVLKPRIVESR